MACSCRHSPYGVNVSRPVTQPTRLFQRCDGRKEPWPQSCMMMKVRTIRPAVGIASSSVSQYDQLSERYITYSMATNGTRVVRSCVTDRRTSGR
jgi:hypothetical protein